ncbi:hypothetical protein CLHOM_30370 [Clostridium homopropionicum DSM 5847]|uniref:DUF4007 domain-containing protein n=1 Tax=Clostridium homopropionicum DSM 5847 TaxID=1121318 RepID=A0A0L6Z7I2_9CLOT|nr:DUF4007 family protein [Clostridium homopropionicum]KOA18753.1 hypothetical protein CLHOM_30370 [Clostridium homopropionicum DSM 5847]SFG54851.1 Protein of unknown function [Clostridium homopropionicum]
MNYKIQSLNGFKMYFDQVVNVFKAKYDTDEDINLDKLAEITGLNRRKARLILNYLADLGLSQKASLKSTELGRLIHKYDDFLEDKGTLWIMHYLQGTNDYVIIWNRLLNFLGNVDTFTREDLLELFVDLETQIGEYTYKNHIGKEIRIIIDAYTNQRFSNLYIIEEQNKKYKVNKNPEVPNLILLAAIKRYQDINYPGATSISINEIATAKNSPGRIFFIDEHVFRQKLEELKNRRYIGIESRADLDQIRIKTNKSFEDIIEVYYGGKEWN